MDFDTLPEFESFKKIPRLHRRCVITEKIDGTNAQVIVLNDGSVHAASRNRYLVEGTADNYSFREWVRVNADKLRRLGPGRHYGEWYGLGIQRGYDLPDRRFALFNTACYAEAPANTGCVGLVPVLYDGIFDSICVGRALDILQKGSVLCPGYTRPEGIVVYHEHSGQLFKVTLENDEQPKGKVPNVEG